MTLAQENPSIHRGHAARYLRPPAPLYFPEQEDVPERAEHKLRVIALFQSVGEALGEQALVASDMFLYWDPTDPKKCLAPDLAVRTGTPDLLLKSWKTWEHGAPHVGVEVVSEWDRAEQPFSAKLERYRQAGIAEVVRFDEEDRERALRLWDLLDGDLVERDLSAPEARFCDAIGLYWCVAEEPRLGPMLRLARDPAGAELLLTPLEMRNRERAEKERERAEKERERAEKEAAFARIAELEAELERRR